MLELENVVTGYGHTKVLHGISMTIGEGEVVSLIGRNGMGKTTTIRSIMGLQRVQEGRIRFRNKDTTTASPERVSQLGMGYVPEGRGIFPTLSVLENLIMSARSGPWTLERIYSMFPRLRERRNNMGHQLSGGEQQMVAIGRALMLNPRMIILDEATEGLAPLVQDEIWACLHTISQTAMSILVIDKDIAALQKIANRHYLIQKGEIRWCGSTEDMRANSAKLDRFIAL